MSSELDCRQTYEVLYPGSYILYIRIVPRVYSGRNLILRLCRDPFKVGCTWLVFHLILHTVHYFVFKTLNIDILGILYVMLSPYM